MENKVEHGSRPLDLSPKEFAVLRTLLSANGQIVDKAQLLSQVWGVEFDPGTNVVEVGIARLRKRLSGSGPERIQTITGQGYRMASDEDAAIG